MNSNIPQAIGTKAEVVYPSHEKDDNILLGAPERLKWVSRARTISYVSIVVTMVFFFCGIAISTAADR